MGALSFLSSWQFILAFYLGIFFLVYYNRDKFDFQGKIVALYRTTIGLKLMKKIATKHKKLIQRLGYVGIIVGYLGMALIVFFIFKGMWDLFFFPEAPATIAPVIPGVKVPGSPIFVPFWYGIISLFIVVLIHEFSHGVVSKAHGVKVNSSGFVLFGPLPGAFVEPDEKKLKAKKPSVQNSVFAAGPFSNILTALLVVAIFGLVVNPAIGSLFSPTGISFSKVAEGHPAAEAGLQEGIIYNTVNGEEVTTTESFINQIQNLTPNETVVIGNSENTYDVIADSHPQNPEAGYIGVNLETRYSNDGGFLFSFFRGLSELLQWILILSLGLGLANLLPIGPVDGGRMFQLACRKFFGKKTGDVIWSKTSVFFLLAVLVLLLVPILRATPLI